MGDQIGVLVELGGAAASDDAQSLAKDIAMHIAWANPEYMKRDEISADAIEKEREIHKQWAIKEGKPENILPRITEGYLNKWKDEVVLLRQPYIRDESMTIQQLMNENVVKLGENIVIRRFIRWALGENTEEA
jgi:elongation factor Ts